MYVPVTQQTVDVQLLLSKTIVISLKLSQIRSQCFKPSSKSNYGKSNKPESEEYETISHTTVCNDLNNAIKGVNLPIEVKWEIHNKGIQDQQAAGIIDVPCKVMPNMMKRRKDIDISTVVCYIEAGRKPTHSQIRNINSKTVCKYF